MTLYTLRYNNYYNRIKKGFNTVAEYEPFVLDTLVETNYNPGDGVATTKTLNISDDKVPDYIIFADDDDTIVSRWFVIESDRIRKRQYVCSLLRDVIMDWKEQIYAAPSFIHKGYLRNNDSGIYNPEDIQVSQIKIGEMLLKDKTNAAWLVGYMAAPNAVVDGEKVPDTDILLKYGITKKSPTLSVPNISQWEYYQYTQNPLHIKRYRNMDMSVDIAHVRQYTWTFNRYGIVSQKMEYTGGSPLYTTTAAFPSDRNNGMLYKDFIYYQLDTMNFNPLIAAIEEQYGITTAKNTYNILKGMVGEVITDTTTNTNYVINLERVLDVGEESDELGDYIGFSAFDATRVGEAFNGIREELNDDFGEETIFRRAGDTRYAYHIQFDADARYKLVLKEANDITALDLIIPNTARILADAPYRMFCIPYGDNFTFTVDGVDYSPEKENAMTLASGMLASGGSLIYDIQLLPYCPIKQIRDGEFDIDELNFVEGRDYVLVPNASNIILFATYSKGTFNIPFVQNGPTQNNVITTKTDALTQFSRLCSPNYSGVFEYSPVKNNGVNYINVDYHYKPFTPYIHLNPDFDGLYGKDFNDARGLICGGDFSITRVDSAWTQYELQNKNYNEIFNKSINKMEFENKYARMQDITNAVSGTVAGAASGAAGGAMVGGVPGAIAGGVVGFGGAAIGGAADVMINEKMRKYNLDFTKDLQSLSLGNIQAIPYSLSKVSAFNNNNKIWPFVENYACTNEEYRAVYDKILYNGMTVNRVGTIEDLLPNVPFSIDYGFFQTTPIRLDNIAEDSHICNAIVAELAQGVFIK